MVTFQFRGPINWLKLPELSERRKRKRSSTYRDISDGLLTPPVRLAANAVAWPAHEIDAIDRARLAGADDAAVRLLVASLIASRGGDA
jgi:prophage regulatory protein